MDHTMRIALVEAKWDPPRPGDRGVVAYCTACGWVVTEADSENQDNFPTADWQAHLEDVRREYLEELQTLRAHFDANFPPKKGKRR